MSANTAPPIETQRLSAAEAAELQDLVGALVVEVYGGDPLQHKIIQPAPYDQACELIKDLAGEWPDRTFAVYRLSRTSHGVTSGSEAQA